MRSYTAEMSLPTIKKIELIDRREFTAMALDKNKETLLIRVTALLEVPMIIVHPSQRAQNSLLLAKKASVIVSIK